jgi:hypothetical protein
MQLLWAGARVNRRLALAVHGATSRRLTQRERVAAWRHTENAVLAAEQRE